MRNRSVNKVGFFSYLLLGGIASYGIHKMKQANEEEMRRIEEKLNEERKRKACRYSFDEGLSEDAFKTIVFSCSKKIKRIEKVEIDELEISCLVSSQSGFTQWRFDLDFNDYGELTGKCFVRSDNKDSNIPKRLNDMIYEKLEPYIEGFEDYSKVSSKEQEKDKHTTEEKVEVKKEQKNNLKLKRLKAFLFNHKKIATNINSTELYRKDYLKVKKHFINEGFTNVKLHSIKDIYIDNKKQVGEIECVTIDGISSFDNNFMSSYDAEIIITYHQKKEFVFPYNIKRCKNLYYQDCIDKLKDIGFTNIFKERVPDLVTGWIKKDGSVESIIVEGHEHLKEGAKLKYNTEITIKYHAFHRKN